MVLGGGNGYHDGILPKMETREPILRRSLNGVRAARATLRTSVPARHSRHSRQGTAPTASAQTPPELAAATSLSASQQPTVCMGANFWMTVSLLRTGIRTLGYDTLEYGTQGYGYAREA